MSSHPPAGWYLDPLRRHERRYWDGSAWTEHVADGQTVGHDPVDADHPAVRTPAWGAPAPAAPAPVAAAPVVQPEPTVPPPTRPPRVTPSRNGLIAAAVVAALLLGTGVYVGTQLSGDDDGGGDGGTTATDVLGAGEPLPGVFGSLDLGATSEPVTEVIGSDGGTIETADGVRLDVPDGAHDGDVTYTVTSTEITGQWFGDLVDPASDLITVDNGGLVATEPVEVTIPVEVDDDQLALAVFYDSNLGRLEPLPMLSSSDGEVVALTRHFSSMFVTVVDLALLVSDTIDSGFRPGIDSWQFVNYGSYTAPNGHCSGQSLSALWYYTEQRVKAGATSLNGLSDNRIDAERLAATAGLQWDDHDGYRLASMVQADEVAKYDTLEKFLDELTKSRADSLQYYAFAYAILLTGEPQYVGLYASAGGGHAMIVYGVTDDALLISDPNYPSEYREIPWNARTGVLGPYMAQANAAEAAHPYEMIGYYGKTALVDWNNLGGRWQQYLDGSIGDGAFPSGTLEVREEDDDGNEVWVPLADGYEVDDDVESITVRLNAPTFNNRLRVFRWDAELLTGGWDHSVVVGLNKGVNQLGFETQGYVWADSIPQWVAFDRVNVIRGKASEHALDLVFVIDLTSSMSDDIDGVKAAARDIVGTVSTTSDDWRVAIVGYRDVGDDPMFEDYEFSDDESEVIGNIDALSVSGGGDTPEAVYEALSRAIDAGTIGGWRDGENKQIILMGDAPPHEPGSGGETAASVAREAELADPVVVQSVVVGNEGYLDPDAQRTFAEISELTFGQTFTATDAAAVPAALQQSIGAAALGTTAAVDESDTDLAGWLLLIAALVLLVFGGGLLILRLLRPSPGNRARLTLGAFALVLGLAGTVWWGLRGGDEPAGRGDPYGAAVEPDDRQEP